MAASVSSGSDDLRIVLVGNTKVGKSASANVIIGREIFRETETTKCEIQNGKVDGRNISVIDTPGINSSTLSSEQLKTEMRRCLLLSHPGPHVFLLVIRIRNFTEDQRNIVEWIQENFGEEALKFTMVLFTGKEDLTNSQWAKFSQDVKSVEFVGKFGLGYFGINSKREVNPAQITKLLEEIETRVQQNGGQYYSKAKFEAFHKKIQEKIEEEKRKKDKERIKLEEEEAQRLKANEKVRRKNTDPISWTSTANDRSPNTAIPQDVTRRRHTVELVPEQSQHTRHKDDQTRTQPKIEIINKPMERSVTMKALTIKNENFRRRKEQQKKRVEEKDLEKKGATGATPDRKSHLRILLLGIARCGKSASGNTILGREAFGKNINSTSKCRKQDGRVGNKILTVIDTKGVSQVADNSTYQTLFEESLSVSSPGPHVFLLVIHSPQILNNTIYPLMDGLGPEFFNRALVLLTCGDIWGTDHRRVLNINPALKRLVNRCGGDYQIFNNMNREDRTQVTDLLEKIEMLVQKNGGQHYTTEMYLEAQRKRMEDRVGVLEERVEDLSRQNKQLTTVILQSQKSKDDGCCLL